VGHCALLFGIYLVLFSGSLV